MNQWNSAVINTVPAANALRRVEGFNPLKFLRKIRGAGGEVYKLELPYQRLWFRLACPNGRIELNRLRITDQLAIFEAIVFSDRSGDRPLSRITASATSADSPNGQYIQAAQDKALSEALENAGFGIQLCDIAESAGRSNYGSMVTVPQTQDDSDLPFTMASAETPPQATNAAPMAEANAVPSAAQPQPTAPVASEPVPAAENVASAPVAEVVSAPEQTSTETAAPEAKPESKVEEQAARLPSSLELLRASTQAQVITFPTQTPAANAPAEQPAPDDNGGEAPANTAQAVGNYTADMPVEEICRKMTLDEARAVVVNDGLCKGWTLEQVAESRPASLRFYVHSNRSDNVLKAAAQLVMDAAALKKAG